MRLQPGGRAVPGVRSLYCLNGWAKDVEAVSGKRAQPPYPLAQYGSMTPLFEEANLPDETIGSLGALGSDGNLWVTLPDGGTPVDATLNAPRNFYAYSLSSQEYKLTLTASSSTTNADLSTNTPEFCVGQQVTFAAGWNSGTPPFTNAIYHWHLPGDYVNSFSYPCDTCSLDYTIDPDQLTNSTTSCWYVDKPGGACSIGMSLQFANGQIVPIAAAGSFKVYKPTVNFTPEPPFTPMVTNGLLELGDSGTGMMDFNATVQSKYSGNVNWTQLINRYGEYGPLPLWYTTTHGSYWLDTSQFYNDEGNTRVNPNGSIGFNDSPAIQSRLLYANMSDSFQTYLVFKPDGDSIWVTLGMVNWGWSGDALYFTSGWELDSSSVTSPTYTDSDAFPAWSQTYTGALQNN
jgi:hypothetical protein